LPAADSVTDQASWDPRLTEARNPRTEDIDRADSRTIVAMIQAEDRSVATAMQTQADALARVVDEVAGRFRRGGRLIYVGAGTSGRLGILDAAECPPTFGTEPGMVRGIIAGGLEALAASSEGAEDDAAAGARAVADLGVGANDFVLGVATSGTTPYVHGALREAMDRGAGLGFLSCSEPPARVRSLGPILVTPLVGPEVVAGSTRMKAGTATKLALNTISTGAMIRSGKVFRNLMVDLRARSAKLVDRGIRIVAHICDLEREPARRLLVSAGGSVRTALAMHLLGESRAVAERCLDAVDDSLRAAVDRYATAPCPCYAAYPETPPWPDPATLVAELGGAARRLEEAARNAADADRVGERVIANPGGWTPTQHVAHLLEFERAVVTPRVARWLAEDSPAFDDWVPDPHPPGADRPFADLTKELAGLRAPTVALLTGIDPAGLARRATIWRERPTLYQFLRGVRQHDRAHALRIEERVHPALLERDRSGA